MRLVLTNCNLIDCVTPAPVSQASVVIEAGRIAEVLDGQRSPDTRDARVIERKKISFFGPLPIHGRHASPRPSAG